ncbi:MAG: hypothetical protein AAF772_07355 [Acidobacteriota bacterium]
MDVRIAHAPPTADAPTLDLPTADAVASVLARLRAQPADASPAERFAHFDRADWPALFHLLTLAADLPRLQGNATLMALDPTPWPALHAVGHDLVHLQTLVDAPAVHPATAWRAIHARGAFDTARDELEAHHCTTVEGLFDPEPQRALMAAIDRLRPTKTGTWGALTAEEAPAVHALVRDALSSDHVRDLTGLELPRDTFQINLSLQDLDPTGIGWHRDLYWPVEWVGRDVFAVFYALGDDDADKGGAFTYYLPWTNEIHSFYRRTGAATVLWNAAETAGRILHAVTGYVDPARTDRHLLILQCLRERDARMPRG